MSYLHCIITRFSFRFKEDDSIDRLLSDERLTERVRLFEKYCYSSIINQTNPNFYWIIIIDPLLPEEYVDQLTELIERHRESEEYIKRGPREIWLHRWDWQVTTGEKLGRIDWILEYFRELHRVKHGLPEPEEGAIERQVVSAKEQENGAQVAKVKVEMVDPELEWKPPKYLITTRLDDDDCLVDTFINLVRKQIRQAPIHGLRYFSFSVGYQHYVQKHALRLYRLPMIALGLTLVAEIDKYPICAYMGSHTQIPNYLKDPRKHKRMHKYYKQNRDLLSNTATIRKQVADRLWVIRTGGPVWVRNVHDFNLQKNIGRSTGRQQDSTKVRQVMKDRFNVQI